MNDSSLRYSDERDKTYGIAGMAITIVALDGEKYLSGISLDAEPGEHIAMSYDYGMRGNPRISAKIIWEQAVNDLRLSTSMVLGNIACRRYVLGHRPLGSADTEAIRLAVRSEAGTHCACSTAASAMCSAYSVIPEYRKWHIPSAAASHSDVRCRAQK